MSTIDNFRNPEFVKAWSRWHTARHAWRRLYEQQMGTRIPTGEDGCDPYNPEPNLLQEEDKPVAVEYLESRSAYLVLLKKSTDA